MGLILLLFISTIITALLLSLKFLLRRRFPANVACWFCGEKTKVPYDNRNCWDCPSCEQYNGFDKDGSYNKPIPAQYDERLNQPIRCQDDEFIGGHNVLCSRCTQNQLLKIKQLANFIPYNEKNYDEEVDAFKRHIEKVYRLCLPCEIKVQQELQMQDEAISRRLYHLDDSRGCMQNVEEEQTFLHSSYIDRRLNKYIMASIILHTVSLACSVLVVCKEISLNGDQVWQKQLLFLHPVLLWLDRNAEFLAVLGLMSGVAAKLCLGKYRLHIIDAVSCPVWLLILLSQTGFLDVHETGSVYHICSLVLNCVTSAVCLGINRRRRDRPNLSMMKMSLDNSISDSVSSVFPYSSVSQVAVRSRSHEERSEIESRSQVTSTTGPEKTDIKFTPTDTTEGSEPARQTDGGMKGNVNIDDTATVLDAFSLGEPSMRRNDSGVFSTVSQGSYASNLSNQSVSENLQSRKHDKGRPLLSPATFKHASTPNKHRSTPVPQYGLFSVPSTDTPPSSFLDRPASPLRSSAFTPTRLFSSERHSFTPERPASPVVTSFGVPPFSNMPLQPDQHSQFSDPTTGIRCFQNISSTRDVARGFYPIAKQPNPIARKTRDMIEDTDSEDDSFSGLTSISKRCPVDSTTKSKAQDHQHVPWWRHPGLIGFVLGGSVVGNVILAAQMAWFNNTK